MAEDKQSPTQDDNAPVENQIQNIESENHSGQSVPPDTALFPLPVKQILLLAICSSLFLVSVFLNITHFSGGDLHSALIIGLIVVTSISLNISFWTIYARSMYTKDGPALVPEKWSLTIEALIKSSKKQHDESQKSLAKTLESSVHQSKKSADLLDSFLTLQSTLNSRDEEIARLKKGYDSKVFKRFLMRFIRLDRALQKILGESKDERECKNYEYLSRVMQDALEECGVEQFTPELGSDYRNVGPQVADEPSVVTTEDETQDFKISGAVSPGYVLEGEGEMEVIVPAKVSIFRFNRKNKGES